MYDFLHNQGELFRNFNWNVKTLTKLFGAVPNVIVDSMSVSIVGNRKHIL